MSRKIDEPKVCPLMNIGRRTDDPALCVGERCAWYAAWYDPTTKTPCGECVLQTLAAAAESATQL